MKIMTENTTIFGFLITSLHDGQVWLYSVFKAKIRTKLNMERWNETMYTQ